MERGHRFVVDSMLGDLARWLRMLGCDVVYSVDMDDELIMEEAMRDMRTIITRDRELHHRAVASGLRSMLVESFGVADMLSSLHRSLGIPILIDPARSRCPKCNGVLRVIDREELIERVPPSSMSGSDTFWVCDGCGSAYWKGGHHRNIIRTLEEACRSMGRCSQ